MESNPQEITFAFGLKDSVNHPRLTVNKKLLVKNSSVFKRMLDNFAIPDVIAIEDIGKSIFQKMVNCLNGEEVEINVGNVLRLMYAGKKYMVEPLSLLCDTFIIDYVTSNHDCTMSMLDSTLKYNRSAIKETCLHIILDDPMRFFEYDCIFLHIEKATLKLILTQPKMNCTEFYLLRAAKKWLEHNDIAKVTTSNDVYAVLKTKFGIEESVLKNKQLYQIKFGYANADHKFIKKFKEITEDISLLGCGSHLYGLVLLIGVHPEREKEIVGSDYMTDTISINIKVKHKYYDFIKVARVVDQPLSKATTIKIMFPKAKIPKSTCSEAQLDLTCGYDFYESLLHIEIDFGSEKFRSVLNKHNCRGEYGYVKTDNNCHMYHSVVSELLCSADYDGNNESS